MPDTESDHHRGVAAVARLELVEPPAAAASSSCATATATSCDVDEDEDDGFTFAAVDDSIPRLQDDDGAFQDDRIGGRVYPVFGRPRRSLSLPKQQQQQQQDEEQEDSAAVPLERLLLAAAAELHGVPAETYCLWSPGGSPPAGSRRASPARYRESGTTGSSVLLRWRRRRRVVDGRSHNDDKDRFVFLGTSSDRIGAGEGHGWMMNRGNDAGKSTTTSFLPCKQDLVELVVSAVTCRRSCYLF